MRVVALLATYNEQRFIVGCLEHLVRNGIEVYLIDNSSTDHTVDLAEQYLGRGLIGIEIFPRAGVFRFRPILQRKERLAGTLDADWFMHVDADEIHLPPRSDLTLAQGFAEADELGYNAVNFYEFTFMPTREAPDHDHPGFVKTMRWYYPYKTDSAHRLSAWKSVPKSGKTGWSNLPQRIRGWKRRSSSVELAWSGGHRVRFPGLRMSPESFRMRHYQFLSIPHAVEKYVNRRYDEKEVRGGWHGWRSRLEAGMLKLPSDAELKTYLSDDGLDPSNPRTEHYIAFS